MTRLETITITAMDYADELFGNELINIIDNKDYNFFMDIIRKVQLRMTEDGKITNNDIDNYFLDVLDAVKEGVIIATNFAQLKK